MEDKKEKGLKSNAFTGGRDAGNPYDGDLGKGIAYDIYEANYPRIEQIGSFPQIVSVYRYHAKQLLSHISDEHQHKSGLDLLDIGSGTGICTLELLCQYPSSKVIGVEISEGMMDAAKYKFHQDDGKELLAHADNPQLLSYWEKFREESLPYKDKAQFVKGDIQEENLLSPESIDVAVANQAIHWTDTSKTFSNFQKWLKPKGEVIWNSASHWYNDANYPAFEYSFRFNDFLKCVLEEIGKIVEVKDIYTLPTPKQDLESIKSTSTEYGLQTEQVATYLLPVDLQIFVRDIVPNCVKQLVLDPKIETNALTRLTKKAISVAIKNPAALADIRHKYDIVPVFRTVKR